MRMKAIILLSLASGYCLSYPVVKTWTFHELSGAVERMMYLDTSAADDDKKPIFDAFELIMRALYSGEDNYVLTMMLSPSGTSEWTKDELEGAMNDPTTDPDLLPFIGSAHQALTELNSRGETNKKDTAEVWVPALDISTWTKDNVTNALSDTKIKGPIYYHLTKAQKQFEEAAERGEKKETISLITPVGLILQKGTKPRFVSKINDSETYPYIIENHEQKLAYTHRSTRLWRHHY